MADGITVSVAAAQSLVTALASTLAARYSTVAGQTFVIELSVLVTLVHTLPTFFCHSQVTAPVTLEALALSTLTWLWVTTEGLKPTVSTGCTTVNEARAQALVELKESTACTR